MPALLVGAMFMALNSLVAVFDSLIVRLVAAEVHPLEIVFFRNFFSLVALAIILPRADRHLRAGGLWPVHIARAMLKIGALVAAFTAVTMLPLSMATAVAFTTPLFVTLGSILVLKEKPRLSRVAALVFGFVGVLIVLRPTQVPIGMGALMALAGAIGLAAVALLLKFSAGRETSLRIVWLNLVVTVPVALLICLPVWSTPSLLAIGLMAVQGIGGLLAQFAFARAMRLADASLLVTIDFIRLPLAAALGFFLFHEMVEPTVLVGGAIVLASIVLLFRHEHAVALQARTP